MTESRRCTNCGNELRADASFCGSCGANVEAVAGTRCPSCGAELAPDAQFCGECGTSVNPAAVGGYATGPAEAPMVSFVDAIRLGFQRYAVFTGRSTRAELWWWTLFVVIADIALSIVDGITGTYGMVGPSEGILGALFGLATILPGLAVGARRLHDINRSGWWLLLWFAIIIGWIVLIVWAIKRGDDGPNRFGPDPRAAR